MFYIQQSGQHDCAYTCVLMILAHFHHDKNYLFISHEDRAYSYKELMVLSESFNLKLIGAKVTDTNEILKCRYFPVMVTLEVEEKVYHSVLLTKITKRKAYIYDPAVGKRVMTFSEFEEKWTKKMLMIDKGDITKIIDPAPDFIAKRDKFTLPLFQILSGLSLLIGTYFIDKNAYIFIPIALFSLFIVFELLFRDNLIKALRRMDDEINYYSLKDGISYHDFFIDSEKYRLKALAFYPNVIYSILISAFITFILIMNDYINLIYIGVAFITAMIEGVIIEPFFNKKANEISKDEEEIKNVKDEEEFKEKSKAVREKAYHISLIKTVSNYLGIGLLLITSIVIMAMSQIVSVTYIFFYLCISVFLRSNFIKMFLYSNESEIKDTYRAKIINYIKE